MQCSNINHRQIFTNRQTLGDMLAPGGVQGSLFAWVFSSQPMFTEIYRLGHYFPIAFAASWPRSRW